MHSVDSAESPKNWESESPNKNWNNNVSESSDSESFKPWENASSTPPRPWTKRPDTPQQKTWIKIPSIIDLNSSRKWEMPKKSCSPEVLTHSWSPQKLPETQKSWLNIPHPDSPKQLWTSKVENSKNWVPINLPKLNNCHKTWMYNVKKQENETKQDWKLQKNPESQPWIENFVNGSKNWNSPNQKRSNSPGWNVFNQKTIEPIKTEIDLSPNADKASTTTTTTATIPTTTTTTTWKKSETATNPNDHLEMNYNWKTEKKMGEELIKTLNVEHSSTTYSMESSSQNWLISPKNFIDNKQTWTEGQESIRETITTITTITT